ncbi:hypothetical protein [Mastigocoleus sp. MO_188.B34]|nr:hypothetical protein [Mastigocoleus sp. MO_188.B34]
MSCRDVTEANADAVGSVTSVRSKELEVRNEIYFTFLRNLGKNIF